MNDCTSLAAEIAELIYGWDGVPPALQGPVPDRRITRAEQELGVTFPPSFRVFLRHFGGGVVFDYEILGLGEEPGHWLDIVQMNCWPPRHIPRPYVLFLYAGCDVAYCLDTSQRGQTGEYAVAVIGPDEKGVVVADSFLDFLRKAKDGLV